MMKTADKLRDNPIFQTLMLFSVFVICIKVLKMFFAFFFGYLCAWIIHAIPKKLKIKRRTAKIFVCALVICVLAFAIYIIAEALYSQTASLYYYIIGSKEYIEDKINRLTGAVTDRSRLIDSDWIYSGVLDIISSLFSKIGQALKNIPHLLLSVGVFFCSLFYFTADLHSVNRFLLEITPRNVKSFISNYRSFSKKRVTECIKGYLLLFLLTVSLLFLLFLTVGSPLPLLLAFCIGILDILPVFGVGTVLLPWSAFCFFSGEKRSSLILFCGFLFISLIRNLAEPKIISSKIGVHPLVMIFSAYLFFCVYGALGLIIAPFFVIFAKILIFDKSRDMQM